MTLERATTGDERPIREENMDLARLGFDKWFEDRIGNLRQPGQSIARVTAVDRGAFLVRDDRGEVIAELAGKVRFSTESISDLPCVGDWVCRATCLGRPGHYPGGSPRRRSLLRRKCPGKAGRFSDDRGQHRRGLYRFKGVDTILTSLDSTVTS